MRLSPACQFPAAVLLALGVSLSGAAPEPLTWAQTTPKGLGITDLRVGDGPVPKLAQVCTVEVRGWVEEGQGKGRLFLDTRKRGYPASFPLGVGRVIPGWDQGIATMKKGGLRLLRVPPALGYTAQEAGQDIPKDAALIFEIELVDLR